MDHSTCKKMHTGKRGKCMLTYEEMQYYAAFAEYGTLTEVAQKYHISQPTITRAMKKAEDVFGIPLFDRTKNSIHLNENGKLAAQEIRLLLKQTDEMINRIREYDRANRTISIGTAADVQLPELIARLTRAFPDKSIAAEKKLPAELEKGLRDNIYQLIILPYDMAADEKNRRLFYTEKIGEEHLMFFLPKKHKYAKRKSLKLEEMNGENMLLFEKSGFWTDLVRKKMTDSRFLVQSERYSFSELAANSVLPCFATNMTAADDTEAYADRTLVPISDPEVNVTYYLTCRKEDRSYFSEVFTGNKKN